MRAADQVVIDFLRSWKRNDADEVVSFLAADATYTDGPRGTHTGREAIREEVASTAQRFPGGFDVTVQSLVTAGRTVMVERTDGFKVAGHSFEMAVAGIFEVNDDGLIVRWQDYFDLRQIQDEVTRTLKAGDIR